MPEVYRESRLYRERDSSPSDDEGRRTTVRRYKVTPSREVDVIEESRSNRYGGGRSSRDDLLEVDRRVYIPERPRSAIDPSPRGTTYVERRETIEREREREPRDRDDHYSRVERVEYRDDRGRGGVVERERVVERDDWDYPERQRTVVERQVVERERDDDYYGDRDRARVVYEKSKEERVERDSGYTPRSPHDWERRGWRDDDTDTEVRVEKRVERREDGTEIMVERRVEEHRDDSRGAEVERYRKETEYYEPSPVPVPIVIRPREQKIIVQEAPPPAPVVIREQTESREVVGVGSRRPERDRDEYYYHKESREVGPYRDEREEYAMSRYEEEPRRHHHHHHHRRRSSGGSEDAYYKKTVVRRERSSSGSPHRKRHIAEGALAGAGISALLSSRRNADGELPEHRGRKVVAGAALGALGTEVVRRAHSAYQERYGDQDERGRSRSRSRSRGAHSRIKTGLGIAAVALAAAGAAKYYQSNKIEKEEMSRGRSRHRYSDSDASRSPSRKRSRSRAASVAKVGLGTAAAAGLIQHIRNKSKTRDGKSRSRSRLRTGASIVAAGLAGAGAKKLYDRQQDKKADREDRRRERELSETESEYERDAREYRRRSRSRSLTRSAAKHPDDSFVADPELGMVEYGTQPLYPDPAYGPPYASRGAGYDSAAEEERSRRKRRGGRSERRSREADIYSTDSEADNEREKKPEKKRSASRLRDLAAGAAAAGAAAIGIKKYSDNKKEKEKEKEDKIRDKERDRDRDRDRHRDRERDHDRDRDRGVDRDRDEDRHRQRERERRRYEDESTADDFDDHYRGRTPSPPTASGGFYSAPPPPNSDFTQHPNYVSTNLNQGYVPYNPIYFPPGPPPNSAASATAGQRPPTPTGPEHVSAASRGLSTPEPDEAIPATCKGVKDGINPSSAPHVSSHSSGRPTPAVTDTEDNDTHHVKFIPLSPQSSRTLRRHHEESAKTLPADEGDDDPKAGDVRDDLYNEDGQLVVYHSPCVDESPPRARRRRDTDPSSNRPVISRRSDAQRRAKAADGDSDEEDVIEYLPDRFDSQGRPLGGTRGHSVPRMHSRRGEFEYHSPRGPNGLRMRGQWGVVGTDNEAVERIVKNVTGVLEGKQSWLGLVGGLLSGSLLKGSDGDRGRINDRDHDRGGRKGVVSDDEEYYRRKDRRRGLERDGYAKDDGYRRRREDERGESSKQGAKTNRDNRKGRRWIDGDDDDDEYFHDGHDYDYGGRRNEKTSDDSDDDGWKKRRRDVRRARTWDVSEREVERDRRYRVRDQGRRRGKDWDDDND